MHMKRLLKGGRVVDPANGRDGVFDVLIDGDRIARVGRDLPVDADVSVVEIPTGFIVCPGLIDMHVHLREPGQEHKETVATGTAAAVAGGFTAVACMPNTTPVNDNAGVTEYMLKKAADANLARVYPIGAVSRGQKGEQLADIAELHQAGCVAITDDGHPVATALLMRRALEYAGMFNMPVIEHCEEQTLKGDGVAHEGFHASTLGLRGIPGEAESIMAQRDIALAELTGGAVHIAHMSARQTLDAVRYGKARGARVTCEVTPHHFVLTDEMLASPRPYDTNVKMNPPLRDERDRDAMLQGLVDGTVDAIATDHAPHHYDEKDVEFDQAPFGITGLETAVSLSLDRLVHAGAITLPRSRRAAVGESGADPQRARRLAVGRRAGGRHDPGARPARDRVGGGDAVEIEEHAVRRLAASRRRGRHDRRRPGRLRQRRPAMRAGNVGGLGFVGRGFQAPPKGRWLDKRTEIREKALKDLQHSEVLMLDGHFDYGNGYHGCAYLTPHPFFPPLPPRLRFAPDLTPSPGGGAAADGGGRRAGRRRPPLAHTIAGLLDSRRSLTHPPCSFAPFNYDPAGGFTLRPFYRRELNGKRVLLVDDVRNTGETFARCAALVDAAGGTVVATIEIYDRCEAVVDLGVPNIALVEYRAPRTTRWARARCAEAGTPITRF